MADHFVYSLGELDYIELAHFVCGQLNNVEMNSTYWKFDWPKAETPVQEGAMFLKQAD
jgi:hypothetical protein